MDHITFRTLYNEGLEILQARQDAISEEGGCWDLIGFLDCDPVDRYRLVLDAYYDKHEPDGGYREYHFEAACCDRCCACGQEWDQKRYFVECSGCREMAERGEEPW